MDAIDVRCTVFILACWALAYFVDRLSPWTLRQAAFLALEFSGCAVLGMIFGYPLIMICSGGITAWLTYLAWTRRKPRQRKPSKVAGRVRDLGHRLVVSAQ